MTARVPHPAALSNVPKAWRSPPRSVKLPRRGRWLGVHEQQLALDRPEVVTPVSLGFHDRDGPVLAFAGLCGGAGATTLAYLTAAAAAIESTVPILLADFGGPGAGVAAYAGSSSNHSFAALAGLIAQGQRPRGVPFSSGEFGMRLLAGAPEIDTPVHDDSAMALLEQARAAHGLTVLDCGQLTRPLERLALSQASHIAWVLPATTAGLRRADAHLATVNKIPCGDEIVAARNDRDSAQAPLAALTDLADQRGAPLLLVPHLPDLADADTTAVLDQASLPLQALGGVLRR